MWDAYEGADKNGSLVYSPERFDPKNHGGKTKIEQSEISAELPQERSRMERVTGIYYNRDVSG